MHRPGPNTGRAQRASGVRFQVLSAGCVGRVGRCLAGVWVRGRVRRGMVRFRGGGLCVARGRRRPSVERATFERGLRRLERLESRLHLGVARVRRSTINVVRIGESAYIFAEEAQAVACRVQEILACCVETGGQGQRARQPAAARATAIRIRRHIGNKFVMTTPLSSILQPN